MRSVQDEQGAWWDVFVGKASYGMLMLLFARRGGDEVRAIPVASDTVLDAEQELGGLNDDQIRARLAQSSIKTS